MDYDFAPQYDHLLTRKCTCGGKGQMLIDFESDFVVRCSNCHWHTHSDYDLERIVLHWNNGDDIIPSPLKIFWDDPVQALKGQVKSIHLSENGFAPITQQSIDFCDAILEYTDKKLRVSVLRYDEWESMNIRAVSGYNPDYYCYTIHPKEEETILFNKLVYSEDHRAFRLEYRWDESWLDIILAQDGLVISRDIVPYGVESPSFDGDYPLTWIKRE